MLVIKQSKYLKMTNQTNPNKSLIVALIFAVCVIIWLIATQEKPVSPIEKPDNSKYENRIDSLEKRCASWKDSTNKANKKVESLNKSLAQNHETVKKQKDEFKTFTPDRWDIWNDSNLRANGIR